jgi:MoxR-like ATPase
VQGTSDLMPADIIGVHIFDNARGQFEFRRGPLFTDVLLFDEINRTGPKTQSALLEAMEERQVSVDREVYPLPEEFLVIATQNPREFEGTYPLPESQLDRFMMRLTLPYLSREHELDVLARYGRVDAAGPQQSVPATTTQSIAAARLSTEQVHVSPELSAYVLDIAKASREHEQLSLGLSTRGTLALLRAARISAGLNGAEFVSPDDVKSVAPLVLPHRLILSAEAVLDGVGEQEVVARLLEQVTAPR